jgi:hypothetical protein
VGVPVSGLNQDLLSRRLSEESGEHVVVTSTVPPLSSYINDSITREDAESLSLIHQDSSSSSHPTEILLANEVAEGKFLVRLPTSLAPKFQVIRQQDGSVSFKRRSTSTKEDLDVSFRKHSISISRRGSLDQSKSLYGDASFMQAGLKLPSPQGERATMCVSATHTTQQTAQHRTLRPRRALLSVDCMAFIIAASTMPVCQWLRCDVL